MISIQKSFEKSGLNDPVKNKEAMYDLFKKQHKVCFERYRPEFQFAQQNFQCFFLDQNKRSSAEIKYDSAKRSRSKANDRDSKRKRQMVKHVIGTMQKKQEDSQTEIVELLKEQQKANAELQNKFCQFMQTFMSHMNSSTRNNEGSTGGNN